MFTQLHIMPDSIYSRTELDGIYFTFKFHCTFCQLDTSYSNEKNSWQALTVSILFVWKSFMKNRLMTKSSEAICYSVSDNSLMIYWTVSSEYRRMTDRQADGQHTPRCAWHRAVKQVERKDECKVNYRNLLPENESTTVCCWCRQRMISLTSNTFFNNHCCRAMLCISAAYAVMRCPSVCLFVCVSRSWIMSNRIKTSSKFFHHQVATPLQYFCAKRHSNTPTVTP